MPRNIQAVALAEIAKTSAIEPVNIIRIQWVAGGQFHYYSDRIIPNQVEGKLISLDSLEAVLDVSKGGTSTSVKVTLDDTSGELKQIFDYNDIHSRPVSIYQWFTDIPIQEMFIIFEGVVSSPVTWNEGNRTLSFDVISKLEDIEAGFSVEDGDFVNVPQNLLGKAWPMIFGTVINCPTLRMDDLPTGTTLAPIGIPDPNISRQINYFDAAAGAQSAKATCMTSRAALLHTYGYHDKANQMMQQAYEMFRNINYNITPLSTRLRAIINHQYDYDLKVIPIANGHKFLQGVQVEIVINRARYSGVFNGDMFMVSSRIAPNNAIHRTPGANGSDLSNPNQYENVTQNTQRFFDSQRGQPVDIVEATTIASSGEDQAFWPCEPPYFRVFQPPDLLGDSHNNHSEGAFFFANAGASVSVGLYYPIRYILSIIPGTQVLSLSSRVSVNGMKTLVSVPPNLYYASWVQYGDIQALIATFPTPLSRIEDSDWEDEVFASLQSPVGPNVVDILIYLIQTYTQNSIDPGTFNDVRVKLTNYPANFPLLTKVNIIELLKDIAWQSRCALWSSDGVFYIKYLSEEGTPVDSINEVDIEQQTLEIISTNTEDLVTKLTATWKDDLSKPEQDKIIVQYNVGKYGLKEQTHNFYIYNSAELVLKSAQFWLIRYANVWKTIKCRAFLTKLKLETLDSVLIHFDHPFVALEDVVGVMDKATFNSSDFSIEMDIWLPVRLGEMHKYIFAYPAGISVQYIFPTPDDVTGKFDNSSPFDAGGDLGARYNAATTHSGRNTQTRPSDQGDTAPIITTTMTVPYGFSTASFIAAQKPKYDYRHPIATEPFVLPPPKSKETYQGVVTDGSGDTYMVTLVNGQEIEAKLYNTIPETEIFPGTEVLVWRMPDGVYYINLTLFS